VRVPVKGGQLELPNNVLQATHETRAPEHEVRLVEHGAGFVHRYLVSEVQLFA
jgi:hypothetical protein